MSQKNSAASHSHNTNAWVVTVNMGYGHMRAAYPLRELTDGHYIVANDYEGIPNKDRKAWQRSREFYEAVSRMARMPVAGKPIFFLLDKWQEIPDFYPRRDLAEATFQVRQLYKLFEKGFLRHLIDKFKKKPMPVVCTFYLPALAAEYFGYKGDIYCVLCDTDIARIWAPMNPKKTRIKYFAPNRRVAERLKLYGVPEKNIYLTGFPLPKELVGGLEHEILKRDLAARVVNLDPKEQYTRNFGPSVCKLLGIPRLPRPNHPLTLTFAVGGAGAQREMVVSILRSLKEKLFAGELRLILVAGSRSDVLTHFRGAIRRSGLDGLPERSLSVIYAPDRNEYFRRFNAALHTTDVLWTKPSELSFFAGLGIPIIIAPAIGSQEDFNASWLRNLGAGIPQEAPEHVDQWLWDWLASGWLARAAVAGFVGGVKRGTYRIEEIIAHRERHLPEPIEPV
ncbi:hypothetical protein EPN90_00010 [Patescibacteria group bacterium]|nr:MAG: hypothetical protein EPN90_00010 [Patescibacteria group bacterium]